ncbi:hypothetical protein TWF718_001224 [Orbilia javanica]|uniref:Peptidase C1A papain C-terminal domain-containing protein n=1 Tax=Orbilia javanica TaxID=47235 RepID=A0AAN8NH94_9PEZI
MKFKYWISGLLVLAGSVASENQKNSTTSTATAHFANAVGDYNRALNASATNPYDPSRRSKLDVWKRSVVNPRKNDDPDPNDPKFDRWLRPPEGPRQIYGCTNKKLGDGLTTTEIKKTGRYMMWQLENSFLSFKSQSRNPDEPCFPVFCYKDFDAVVAMCNRRQDMAQTVVIYGYEIGKMVWEMGVAVGLDTRQVIEPWEGSKRVCRDPESEENGEDLTGHYVAWTGWSEDQWEVSISKEPKGCGLWAGEPNWVTTGNGVIPDDYPLDMF